MRETVRNRRLILTMAICILIALPEQALSATPPKMELTVGAARQEIHTPPNLPLAGYSSRFNKKITGHLDPIYSRAIVMETHNQRAVIVNADILLVDRHLRQDLTTRLTDLHIDFLALSATHTHSSMGGYINQWLYEVAVMGLYKPKAKEALLQALESSVRQAVSRKQPAQVGFNTIQAPRISYNRRGGNGPVDSHVRQLSFWSPKGTLIAALVNYAMHPVTLPQQNTRISGETPGVMARALEKNFPQAVVVFTNAGLGDQSPRRDLTNNLEKTMRLAGQQLATVSQTALQQTQRKPLTQFTMYDHHFPMPPMTYFTPKNGWNTSLNGLFSIVSTSMFPRQGHLMGLQLNDTLILFSPAEVTYTIQQHLEHMFPKHHVMVVTHANDYYGYVLTPEEYEGGGYEVESSFYGKHFATLLENEFRHMVWGTPTSP